MAYPWKLLSTISAVFLFCCETRHCLFDFSTAFLRFNCVWEFSTRRHIKFVCLYLLRKIELLADDPPHLDYWKARPCSQIQVFQVKVQVFISTQMKSSLLMAFFFRAPGDWKFCAAGHPIGIPMSGVVHRTCFFLFLLSNEKRKLKKNIPTR